MVRELEACAVDEGVGRRVMWMGLAFPFLLLLRASELVAEDGGKSTRYIALRRGDNAFSQGNYLVDKSRVERRTRWVEVRVRGSKGDQGRKGGRYE